MASKPVAPRDDRRRHCQREQILLVEDDEIFRDATAALLRSAGYAVHVAPDHRLALEIGGHAQCTTE